MNNGSVTDEGVDKLRKIKRLKSVTFENLQGVRDPEKIIANFKASLPECEVVWYGVNAEKPEVTDEEIAAEAEERTRRGVETKAHRAKDKAESESKHPWSKFE